MIQSRDTSTHLLLKQQQVLLRKRVAVHMLHLGDSNRTLLDQLLQVLLSLLVSIRPVSRSEIQMSSDFKKKLFAQA